MFIFEIKLRPHLYFFSSENYKDASIFCIKFPGLWIDNIVEYSKYTFYIYEYIHFCYNILHTYINIMIDSIGQHFK